MKTCLQIDNPTHLNAKGEVKKALKALEIAKKIPRKVVFLKQGESLDIKIKQK